MMTESEFIRMSEELFEHIDDQIDENGWDFDCQFAGNVLTIEAEDGTQIIVNRHTPNQELWIAAKSGGYHFAEQNGKVIAYCRLIPHGGSVHLGRVLVLPGHRAEKLGRKIVAFAVDYARAHFPQCSVYAQAQAYLERFYASFGFASQSAPYLEDNIPHIDMLLPAAQS